MQALANPKVKMAASALMLTILVFLILGLTLIQAEICNTFNERMHSGSFPFIDFLRFYSAGQVVLSPDRANAYGWEIQCRYLNEMIAPAKVAYTSESHYLPFAFPLFALFATMPVKTAYTALDILGPLIGLGTVGLLLVGVRRFNTFQTAAFLMGMLASFPGWRCMFAGNLSWVLMWFICPFVWAELTNRKFLAGVFLALTTFKYNYTPHLLASFVGMRDKRAFVGLFAGGFALFLLGGFFMGWESYISWPKALLSSEGSDWGVFPELMTSVVGPLSNVLPRHTAAVVAGVTELISLVVLFWVWFKFDESGRNVLLRKRWLFAITALTMVTFNVHVHNYESMFLVIAPALTLTRMNPADVLALKSIPFRLWSFAWITAPIWGWGVMVLTQKYSPAFGLITLFQLVMLIVAVGIYRKLNAFASSEIELPDAALAEIV